MFLFSNQTIHIFGFTTSTTSEYDKHSLVYSNTCLHLENKFLFWHIWQIWFPFCFLFFYLSLLKKSSHFYNIPTTIGWILSQTQEHKNKILITGSKEMKILKSKKKKKINTTFTLVKEAFNFPYNTCLFLCDRNQYTAKKGESILPRLYHHACSENSTRVWSSFFRSN